MAMLSYRKQLNTRALTGLIIVGSFVLFATWQIFDGQHLRKNALSSFSGQHTVVSIPKTIWYKLGPEGLSKDASGWVEGCLSKNPGWKAQYMMDENADEWVSNAFEGRPDVVQSFQNLTIPILKADFLRYLLLFHEGGMWFDLDVECGHGQIDDWIPTHLKANTSLVVGWEFDAGIPMDQSHQLESWTIMSRPGSPYMLQAIGQRHNRGDS